LLRSGGSHSQRDRALAELNRKLDAIDAQRDVEKAVIPAETTIRNNNAGSSLSASTGSADGVKATIRPKPTSIGMLVSRVADQD
jgi:hypothetical protein